MVWNLFPFKSDFSFGKSQKSHLDDLMSPKNSTWDVIHEWVHCCDEAANHQLPIAAAFWIIEIISAKECSSLTENLMQIHCSTPPVILNVMATQYACSLNSIFCSHWLVQWSHHCSHMHIPVHSLWLPGYIDVLQTILNRLKIFFYSYSQGSRTQEEETNGEKMSQKQLFSCKN